MILDQLSLDLAAANEWFEEQGTQPYTLIRCREENTDYWVDTLQVAIRQSYIDDRKLLLLAEARNAAEVVSSHLPDAGSVMSGDFGEILTYIYHAAKTHPQTLFGAKKWRLKEDRRKPAPHSDVVQFLLPTWPQVCDRDAILCSEVKTKATDGISKPISSAIEDSQKDQVGRLSRTLVWLKERVITENMDDATLNLLKRFIEGDHNPPCQRRFYAVAVISAELVEGEIAATPEQIHGCELIVLAVPSLYEIYNAIYDAIPARAGAGT